MATRTDPEIMTPATYDEATSGPQKRQREAAIADELQALGLKRRLGAGRWRQRTQILSATNGVFKVKRAANRQIERYKARVVARGFSQQYGVDYEETFAPVVRMERLHILLATAAVEDLKIHQMEVVTAYLAGELEEEIYMALPQD